MSLHDELADLTALILGLRSDAEASREGLSEGSMMPDAGAGRSNQVCGDAAVGRFHRLPEPRTELAVTCQYTGNQSLTIRFGTAADLGYVYVEGSEQAPHLMTASGEDMAALFECLILYIEMRHLYV